MIYMWFTGINYYKLAVEKDRESIFTTITTIWNPGWNRYISFLLKHWTNLDSLKQDKVRFGLRFLTQGTRLDRHNSLNVTADHRHTIYCICCTVTKGCRSLKELKIKSWDKSGYYLSKRFMGSATSKII
jgi:hypothetical protein